MNSIELFNVLRSKKIAACFSCLFIALCGIFVSSIEPVKAQAVTMGTLEVTGGTSGTDFALENVTYSRYARGNNEPGNTQLGRNTPKGSLVTSPAKQTLVIKKDCNLVIKNASGTTTSGTSIRINPGVKATITLAGVSITSSMPINIMTNSHSNGAGATTENTYADIAEANRTKLHLILADGTTNRLTCSTYSQGDSNTPEQQYPGIRCGEGSVLVIDDGTSNTDIDGNHITPVKGRIPIGTTYIGNDGIEHTATALGMEGSLSMLDSKNPGRLYVYGGVRSAAIGGGPLENAGDMTFDGGTLEIHTNGYGETNGSANGSGAAIGGGHAGGGTFITINGGYIDAWGGYHSAGIGGGCTYNGGMSGYNTYPFADAILSQTCKNTLAGDITINGGFTKAHACWHSNAFGMGCGGNNNGHTILITGGTLLPVPSKNESFGDIGGNGGYVVITGGSVNCSKNSSGKYRFSGNDNDGKAYGNLERTFKVSLTTTDVKSKLDALAVANGMSSGNASNPGSNFYNAKIESWELLVNKFKDITVTNTTNGVPVTYEYGSPAQLDNCKLYLWLPENINVSNRVDVNFGYMVGSNLVMSEATQPATGTPGSESHPREVEKIQLTDYMEKMNKFYDGTALPQLPLSSSDSSTWIALSNPAGKYLTDPTKVSYEFQRYDEVDGEALEAASTIMPSDTGVFNLEVLSTQYGNTAPFSSTYWAHSCQGWAFIKPVLSKSTMQVQSTLTQDAFVVTEPIWYDGGDPTTAANDHLYIPAAVSGDSLPDGADYGNETDNNTYRSTDAEGNTVYRTKETCDYPEGKFQLYIDNIPVPEHLGGVIQWTRANATSNGVTLYNNASDGNRKSAKACFDIDRASWCEFVKTNGIIQGDMYDRDPMTHSMYVAFSSLVEGADPSKDSSYVNYYDSQSETIFLASPVDSPRFGFYNEYGTGYIPGDTSADNKNKLKFDAEQKQTTYTYRLIDFQGDNQNWFPLYARTNSGGNLGFASSNESIISVSPELVTDRYDEYLNNEELAGDGATATVLKSGRVKIASNIVQSILYHETDSSFNVSIIPDLSIEPAIDFTYTVRNTTRSDNFVKPNDNLQYTATFKNTTEDSAYMNPVVKLTIPRDTTLSSITLLDGKTASGVSRSIRTLVNGVDYVVNGDVVTITSMLPLYENDDAIVVMNVTSNTDIFDYYHMPLVTSNASVQAKLNSDYDSFNWEGRNSGVASATDTTLLEKSATPPTAHIVSYENNASRYAGYADLAELMAPFDDKANAPDYIAEDGTAYEHDDDAVIMNWKFEGWFDTPEAADVLDRTQEHDYSQVMTHNIIVYAGWTPLTGTVEMDVSSDKPEWTTDNDRYKFDGAVYTIYPIVDGNVDRVNPVATITIDEDGHGTTDSDQRFDEIRTGQYSVELTHAPTGFREDTVSTISNKQTITVTSDNKDNHLMITDVLEAQRGTIGVIKQHKSDWVKGNVNYGLEGAKYVLTGTYQSGEYATDSDGKTSPITVPLGIYTVNETEAPTGSLLDETVFDYNIANDKQNETAVSYEPLVLWQYSDIPDITKVDVDTRNVSEQYGPEGNATLSGAEYTISYKESIDAEIKWSETITTSKHDNDYISAVANTKMKNDELGNSGWPLGVYEIKETKAPDGYYLDSTVYQITVSDVDDVAVAVLDSGEQKDSTEPLSRDNGIISQDELIRGDIEITKYVNKYKLSDDTPYDVALAPDGVQFQIINDNDFDVMRIADKTWAGKGSVVCTVSTGAANNGVAETTPSIFGIDTYANALTPGKYIIHEVPESTPIGYQTANDVSIVVEPGKTTKQDIENKQGTAVRITKKDAGSNRVIEGTAKYSVYDSDGDIVSFDGKSEFASDEHGILLFPGRFDSDTYVIKETAAPFGYLQNDSDDYAVSFTATGETTNTFATPMELVYVNDAVTGSVSVNIADNETHDKIVLSNAKIKLVAKTDIYTADGSLRAEAGKVMGEGYTDGGTITFNDLYPGTYTASITEIPTGYFSSSPFDITLSYVNDRTPAIVAERTFELATKRYLMSIEMQDKESGKPICSTNTNFKVIAKEDIVTPDNRIRYSAGDTVIANIATSNSGTATTSAELYPGKYTFVQTAAAYGYVMDGSDTDCDIVVSDENVLSSEKVFISNTPQTGRVTVAKRDGETGKVVGTNKTIFSVYAGEDIKPLDGVKRYSNGERICDIETGSDGFATTDYVLYPGKYFVREKVAPEGYLVISSAAQFTLPYSGSDKEHSEQVELPYAFKDMPSKGSITITRKDSDTDENIHEMSVYNIVASDDVVTPDGTVRHHKGDLVKTVSTDESGNVVINDMYIGEYNITEITAPNGYLLSDSDSNVSVEYNGQNEPGAFFTSFDSLPQMGVIEIEKVDSLTGDVIEAAGTGFAVYAKEDIVTADGTIRAKAGDLVCECETADNGIATSEALYLGKYEVIETKTPNGYMLDKTKHDVELVYAGQDVELSYSKIVIEDNRTVIGLHKSNENNDDLEGVSFAMWTEKDANPIENGYVYLSVPKMVNDSEYNVSEIVVEGYSYDSDKPENRYDMAVIDNENANSAENVDGVDDEETVAISNAETNYIGDNDVYSANISEQSDYYVLSYVANNEKYSIRFTMKCEDSYVAIADGHICVLSGSDDVVGNDDDVEDEIDKTDDLTLEDDNVNGSDNKDEVTSNTTLDKPMQVAVPITNGNFIIKSTNEDGYLTYARPVQGWHGICEIIANDGYYCGYNDIYRFLVDQDGNIWLENEEQFSDDSSDTSTNNNNESAVMTLMLNDEELTDTNEPEIEVIDGIKVIEVSGHTLVARISCANDDNASIDKLCHLNMEKIDALHRDQSMFDILDSTAWETKDTEYVIDGIHLGDYLVSHPEGTPDGYDDIEAAWLYIENQDGEQTIVMSHHKTPVDPEAEFPALKLPIAATGDVVPVYIIIAALFSFITLLAVVRRRKHK